MAIIVQQPVNEDGRRRPMVYDEDTGKVIVDTWGNVLMGGSDLINEPSRYGYVTTQKTQTSGIQEAINYVITNGGGKIHLKKGRYVISKTSYTYTRSITLWNGMTSQPTSIYGIIPIPVPSSEPAIYLEIEGEGGLYSMGEASTTTPTSDNEGLTIIDMSNLGNIPSPKPNGSDVLAGLYLLAPFNANNLNINIHDIFFLHPPTTFNSSGQATNTWIGAMAFMYVRGGNFERMTLIPTNFAYNWPSSSSVDPGYSVQAFAMDGWGGDGAWANNIFVGNFPVAYFLGAHLTAGTLQTQGCYYSTIILADHAVSIQRLDIQHDISYINLMGGSSKVYIGTLDGEDPNIAKYHIWFGFQGGNVPSQAVVIDFWGLENNQTSSGIGFPIINWNGNAYSPSINNNTAVFEIKNFSQYNINGTYSSTSGPTAGTVQMNLKAFSYNYMKYVITFSGYENNTTTNQTINFPTSFLNYATITTNTTGLTISTTTTGITITSPNSTTTYSGIVIVEGY